MSKSINFVLQEMPEDEISSVQLIRKGVFDHAMYGKFDINEDVLRQFKANFDGRARRVDIAVDYFHESYADAAGWIRSVELREADTQLWIEVEWTEKAKEKILSKEIRYISADFDLDYTDSETKVEYGATLFGAGLTNRPHVKDMKAIFSDEIVERKPNINNEEKTMPLDFNEIINSVSELSEDEKLQLGEKLGFSIKTSEVEKKLSDAKAKLNAESSAVKKLSDTVSGLEIKLAEQEKQASFNKMLNEGNAVEAQRDAFMKGDIAEFAKNAVSINLSEKGSGSDESNESNEAEKKLSELANEKAKNEGIRFSEAYKAVAKENPSLFNKVS